MSGPYFTNLALVHDSDFGVITTMDAASPYHPVFCYFNHKTMDTNEVKYFRYQTQKQALIINIFPGSDANNFKIMVSIYDASGSAFFMNLRDPQLVCYDNCETCADATNCSTCVTTYITDGGTPT